MNLAQLGRYFQNPPPVFDVTTKRTALAIARHAASKAMHYRIIGALAKHKHALWEKRAEAAFKAATK